MGELSKNQISSDIVNVNVDHTTFEIVDINDIASPDLERNPRDENSAYNVKTNEDMIALVDNMRSEGWKAGSVVSLHRNTMRHQGNTLLQIVRGHCRYYAALEAGIITIPANIYTNMTDKQIYDMLVEQKGINYGQIGELKAVTKLILDEGLGQDRIAKRLRIPTGRVQDYRSLSRLPQSLIEAWKTQIRGGDKKVPFLINQSAIRSLYAALLRDQNGKTLGPDKKDIDSGRPKCYDANGGVEYQEAYDKLLLGEKPKPKVSADELRTLALTIKEPTLREFLFATAEGDTNRGTKLNTAADKCAKFDNLDALNIDQPQLKVLLESSIKPLEKDGVCDVPQLVRIAKWVVDACNEYIGFHPETDPLVDLPSTNVPGYEGALPAEEPVSEEPVSEEPVSEKPVSEEPVTTSKRGKKHARS